MGAYSNRFNPPAYPIGRLAWYQCDHLGTPQELTDEQGRIAWTAQYQAWGMAREAIRQASDGRAPLRTPIRFQGQYHDHETGLHYNRYRYYDPEVGRFVSKDPIKLRGGLNNYLLAPNPIYWVDPLGLRCKKGRFSTSDAAAKAALTRFNPKSIRDNLEYGGLIYKANGGYDFTKGIRGRDQGINPWKAKGSVPKCGQAAGDYYTHGDYSMADSSGKAMRTSNPNKDDFNSDNFSLQDYAGISHDAIGKSEYKGYLGTPSGIFKVFDPSTGVTENL